MYGNDPILFNPICLLKMTDKPSCLNFDKPAYAWKPNIDYQKYPEQYKVGKGE